VSATQEQRGTAGCACPRDWHLLGCTVRQPAPPPAPVPDMALRLKLLRQRAHLTQPEAAARSGIGVKSISSFETGRRINSLKVSQLMDLLDCYDASTAEFFEWDE